MKNTDSYVNAKGGFVSEYQYLDASEIEDISFFYCPCYGLKIICPYYVVVNFTMLQYKQTLVGGLIEPPFLLLFCAQRKVLLDLNCKRCFTYVKTSR